MFENGIDVECASNIREIQAFIADFRISPLGCDGARLLPRRVCLERRRDLSAYSYHAKIGGMNYYDLICYL